MKVFGSRGFSRKMGNGGFVHLHTHSEFSLLDGACKIKDLVKQAVEFEMPSLAITDHGVMFGCLNFYQECKKQGIKPIVGCEVYVAPRKLTDKEGKLDAENYHLVLLAQNETGYRNLLKLASTASLDGFYYKPRVDKELLAQYSEGLIAMTACLGGEVTKWCAAGDIDKAEETFCQYRDIFGKDNLYLEIQDHNLPEQKVANEVLVRLSERLNVPLVATNDIHYLKRENSYAHDVLLCIGTGNTMDDPKRFKFGSEEFYMKNAEEMARTFKDYPGSTEITLEIAERCNLKLDFDRLQLPAVELPPGKTVSEHMADLCWEALPKLYPNVTPEIEERLRYEIDVINKTGFPQYMLIVRDFATFARENNIYIGLRGSAAGALVCYCLGISNVDPIYYKLIFERFLNIERAKMPDIDMDMADDRREDLIRYVTQKYGPDKVSQIVTFGTLAAKAAVRDCGRALGMQPSETDKICKMIPSLPVGISLDRAMEDNPDLKTLYRESPPVRKLIDTAKQLEGLSRHASVHAAGVIIAYDPLTDHVPLMKAAKGEGAVTQYDADGLAKIGLLKMDFLGLANLTTLSKTVENIKKHRGEDMDIWNIPLDDKQAFEMLGQGDTTGVFQLESVGMRRNIQELKPENIPQLAAMIALYRPGPMANIPTFIKGKAGLQKVKYIHPKAEPILKETFGVIVFQEQVIHLVQAIAGFTLGQADIMRQAMSKKKKEDMEKAHVEIIEGAVKNGISKDVAEEIYAQIEPFAGYAFNKSHATCYAVVAYQTAYLKANYGVEYMAAILATNIDNKDKIALYIDDCRKRRIEVLPPDVNISDVDFSVQGDAIRFGLAAIKNCGRGIVDEIIAERTENGEFKSLSDFCERVCPRGVGKSSIECLIKAGALTSIHKNRAGLAAAVDEAVQRATRLQRDRENGQEALFGGLQDEVTEAPPEERYLIETKEYPREELLAMEKDLLGLYVSDHPLSKIREVLEDRISVRSDHLGELADGEECIIGGLISEFKHHRTKKNNDLMAFIKVEDLWGTVAVTVFPKSYKACEKDLELDKIVLIKGKASHRDRITKGGDGEAAQNVEIICDTVEPLVAKNGNGNGNGLSTKKSLHLRICNGAARHLGNIRNIFARHSGDDSVCFHICENGGEEQKVMAPYRVSTDESLVSEIAALVGSNAVWIE